ncbi:hypothetical protein BS50DRAFT_630405 [Corynespora cassiicola Philippines]|uniref:Uncharacterized protein n=1 Tax=Corynespora cassiicola Philippines TaxID=1448308 RepID=A0A2T2P3X5_CORCC|nr:hypothetical protein BS50DRAFT_630405 [Corynespora cassiicola Philippines]
MAAYQAQVEDCSDAESDGGGLVTNFNETPAPDTPRTTSPSKANVATKRSHPSDLGVGDKAPAQEKVVTDDLQSESGYSCHTAATASSADSAQSTRSSRSPSSPPTSVASVPLKAPQRRPTVTSEDRKSSHTSTSSQSRKPLGRSSSTRPKERPAVLTRESRDSRASRESRERESRESREPRREAREAREARDEYSDPHNTSDFEPRVARGALVPATRRPPPREYYPTDQHSQRSDLASNYNPPSPTYHRQTYAHGSTLVQTGQTRRRASSTTRPTSYHGPPGQSYNSGAPSYPSPPQEHGPPPSISAYSVQPHYQQQSPMFSNMMAAPTPPGYYNAMPHQMQHQMQQSTPPYEYPRPPMPSRNSTSSYNTRPASAHYNPLVIQQDQGKQALPSARFPPQGPRPERQLQVYGNDSDSESDYSAPEVKQLPPAPRRQSIMAPPAKPTPPPKVTQTVATSTKRRPSLRHPPEYHSSHRLSQSQTLPERPRERELRESDKSRSAAPSRRPSVSRATTTTALVHSKGSNRVYDDDRSNGRVIVEQNRRRAPEYAVEERRRRREPTVYRDNGYDDANEKQRRRQSRVYDEEVEEKRHRRGSKVIRAPPPPPPPPPQDDDYSYESSTDEEPEPERHRRANRPRRPTVSEQQSSAQAYMNSTRGNREDLSDRIHSVVKGGSHISGPSEAGSSRSRGSDKQSQYRDEIRLRVDASAPLSLQFNGDMEGRNLQIVPVEGGMADIVIGNPGQRAETVYHASERGSERGGARKLIAANSHRRDAEERSVKSSRTAHSRRHTADRQPLRRTTNYY